MDWDMPTTPKTLRCHHTNNTRFPAPNTLRYLPISLTTSDFIHPN